MRVRFIQASASPAGVYQAGQLADIEPAAVAVQLVESGVAEPVPSEPEAAVVAPTSTAVVPTPRRRRPR